MITFIDGPASGQHLSLSRAPIMLRVVQSRKTGEWDALDMPADAPGRDEEIHIYQLASDVQSYHVSRSPRRLSGWFHQAAYRYHGPVDDTSVRENDAWAQWCDVNKSDLLAAYRDGLVQSAGGCGMIVTRTEAQPEDGR